jgi:restriction system protein
VAIPDYQALMLPVLRVAEDGEAHSVADIRVRLADEFKITAEEQAQPLPSGTGKVFISRVAWAVQYLKQAGAIETVQRGVYRITERGRSLAKNASVTVKTLSQFPEFLRFSRGVSAGSVAQTGRADPQPAIVETTSTPEESLESSFRSLREALATELLETIKSGTPAAFEQIVVDLLVAMGYGGSAEDAGRVVGQSGDGGIDGIIKQDKLGLEVIYVQAKRWKENVGSPEIMKFSGGLTKRHASRGVFITTSAFTERCAGIRASDAPKDRAGGRPATRVVNDRT